MMDTKQYAKPLPEVGGVISYKLRPDQFPKQPDKIWIGRILKIFIDINDRAQRRYYLIVSIEQGYIGFTELVYPEQVI